MDGFLIKAAFCWSTLKRAACAEAVFLQYSFSFGCEERVVDRPGRWLSLLGECLAQHAQRRGMAVQAWHSGVVRKKRDRSLSLYSHHVCRVFSSMRSNLKDYNGEQLRKTPNTNLQPLHAFTYMYIQAHKYAHTWRDREERVERGGGRKGGRERGELSHT